MLEVMIIPYCQVQIQQMVAQDQLAACSGHIGQPFIPKDGALVEPLQSGKQLK